MLSSQSLALAAEVAGFPPAPNTYEFQQSKRHGFLYYKITKCGCTFARALINQMDGRPRDAVGHMVQWANDTRVAFVVVRNPLDRFLSLYFNKILGGPSHMAKGFLRRGLINPDAQTAAEHERNCLQALGWINATMNGGSVHKVNFHWRPQVFRLHKVSKLNVHMLTMDGLSWQLEQTLGDQCPDIAAQITKCGRQNVSPKPINPALIATQRLRRQISRIYAADERVYAEANRHWAKIGTGLGHHGQDIKQTARGWLVTDRQACGDHIQRGGEQSQMGA